MAFDVKIERDAQEMADSVGVKIFQADIIYHLFDSFMKYRDELKAKKREEFKDVAVFPCKLRILPQVNAEKSQLRVGLKLLSNVTCLPETKHTVIKLCRLLLSYFLYFKYFFISFSHKMER